MSHSFFLFCKQKTAYERRISDWSSDVCSSDLSTLWRYFSSKEELFAAVLDDATAEFKRELGELLLSHQGVRNTLMRLCLHFIEKLVDPRSIRLHRLIHGEGGRFPEIGLIFYERAP